jgi:hypothetical protein
VAHRKLSARRHPRLPARARAFALAAALAAALAVAGCTSSSAGTGTDAGGGARGTGGTGGARGGGSPAVTAAQARQVWERYAAVAGDPARVLALETGPQRAFDAASLKGAPVTGSAGSASAGGASAGGASAGRGSAGYGAPTFLLPEQSGYPRFFVADVTQRPNPGAVASRELLLFKRAGAGAPWLLAGASRLTAGASLPALAARSGGYLSTVTPTTASLLAQPDDVGPLQAAVVDDGPASAASKVVAAGQLSTGLYQAALDHAGGGMTAPRGDVYQWELDGSSFPEFALRTAAGGALVFYAMSLDTTVAVPDVINKANPIRSGPPIAVPAAVRALLPPGRPAPLVQLQSQQTLTFAAIDPAPGNAKIQVIAMGGGLTSASAS